MERFKVLAKKTDSQGQYSRRDCLLVHGIEEMSAKATLFLMLLEKRWTLNGLQKIMIEERDEQYNSQ